MSKSISRINQALYLGKWVDKQTFRAFVYDKKGDQKLANSYAEFEDLTSSGIWFAQRQEVSLDNRKQKDAIQPNS